MIPFERELVGEVVEAIAARVQGGASSQAAIQHVALRVSSLPLRAALERMLIEVSAGRSLAEAAHSLPGMQRCFAPAKRGWASRAGFDEATTLRRFVAIPDLRELVASTGRAPLIGIYATVMAAVAMLFGLFVIPALTDAFAALQPDAALPSPTADALRFWPLTLGLCVLVLAGTAVGAAYRISGAAAPLRHRLALLLPASRDAELCAAFVQVLSALGPVEEPELEAAVQQALDVVENSALRSALRQRAPAEVLDLLRLQGGGPDAAHAARLAIAARLRALAATCAERRDRVLLALLTVVFGVITANLLLAVYTPIFMLGSSV